MVYFIENNTHMNDDARDGREWDALLRARTQLIRALKSIWGAKQARFGDVLQFKIPRTSPEAYINLLIPYCKMGLS